VPAGGRCAFRIGKVKVSLVEGTDAPSESSQESEGTGPYQNFSSVECKGIEGLLTRRSSSPNIVGHFAVVLEGLTG
jgi:hypothetical protein